MAAALVPIISALIGAVGPTLVNKIFSPSGNSTPGGGKYMQFPNLDPTAMRRYQQFANQGPPDITQNPLYQNAGNYYQNLLNSQFNPSQYEQMFQTGIVNPALRDYEQRVLPMIHSRFTTPSGTYGSALDQALNRSAMDLNQDLASLRAGFVQRGQEQFENQKANAALQALNMSQIPYTQSSDWYSRLFNVGQNQGAIEYPQNQGMDLLKGLISAAPNIIKNWPQQSAQQPSQPTAQGGMYDYIGGRTPAPNSIIGSLGAPVPDFVSNPYYR